MKLITASGRSIILAVMLIMGSQSYSQEVKVQRRNIQVAQTPSERPHPDPEPQIGITVDPLRIISGEFPVSVQYSPNDWLQIELGTGITWTNYYMLNFGTEWLDLPYLREYSTETPNINPSFLFETKFFPGGYAFDDGWYLGLRYQYRRYEKNIFIGDPGASHTYNSSISYQDIALIYGGQYLMYVENIYLDYYVGLGGRLTEKRELGKRTNTSTGEVEYVNVYSFHPNIAILAGIKIGYLF